MDDLRVRYGSSINLKVEASDTSAEVATLYVGKPGQLPVIIVPASFSVDDYEPEKWTAYIHSEDSDTEVPLGRYNYQISVTYADGKTIKYPTNEGCHNCDDDDEDFVGDLPDFYVLEALDSTEVVS